MAIEKIKLTSQTAWETQKKLNDNFSELEGRIDDIEVPTKTSDLTNDGDGTSPFATEDYVAQHGGKIDSISVNGTPQTIDANKNVNITVPTKTSDITNDSGFIDKTVNDLVNYYTKNDTYSKTEVNTLISGLKTISYEIVSTLPTASVTTYFNESKTIYMTPISSGSGNNYYNEYITTRSGSEGAYTYSWELIGSTQVDLSNYVQKTTTIAGITLEANITTAQLQTALQDATHRFVTDAQISDWNSRQTAIQDISFTVSDAGWSATADANGFYTLTIPSTGKPMIVYNSNGEQVLAGLKSDGTNVYIVTDTKFTGSVSVK